MRLSEVWNGWESLGWTNVRLKRLEWVGRGKLILREILRGWEMFGELARGWEKLRFSVAG